MDTNDPTDQSPDDAGPSKSQVKRDMIALQDLGVELTALSPGQIEKLSLPEVLRNALRDAQQITQNGARKRQRQYIGKLLRDIDPEPIKELLDDIKGVSAAANARQHALERQRTQLMESEDTLGEIARTHPHADIQHLRQLRRNALKEQQLGKPPKAYRELFRVLRSLQNNETSFHE